MANFIYRFAFGDPGRAGSSIWRVVVHKKKGDVFIGPLKGSAKDFHISLHASGFCSLKTYESRKILPPPTEIEGRKYACLLYFPNLEGSWNPIEEKSKKSVNYTGWPKANEAFDIAFFYSVRTEKTNLFSNIPAISGNKKRYFNAHLRKATLSAQDRETLANIADYRFPEKARDDPDYAEEIQGEGLRLFYRDGVPLLVMFPIHLRKHPA